MGYRIWLPHPKKIAYNPSVVHNKAKLLTNVYTSNGEPLYVKLSKYNSPKDEMEVNAMNGAPYASECSPLMYFMVVIDLDIPHVVEFSKYAMSKAGKG